MPQLGAEAAEPRGSWAPASGVRWRSFELSQCVCNDLSVARRFLSSPYCCALHCSCDATAISIRYFEAVCFPCCWVEQFLFFIPLCCLEFETHALLSLSCAFCCWLLSPATCLRLGDLNLQAGWASQYVASDSRI